MIRHDTRERPASTPIALPLVEVTIPDDGPITVAVDGAPLTPAAPLDRSTLRAQIIELARLRGTALQVRVTEGNLPPFTDVITPDDAAAAPELAGPARSVPPAKPDDAAPAARPGPHREGPRLAVSTPSETPFHVADDGTVVGLTGEGFLPGEHVAFAVVVIRHVADDDGTASLHLPPGLLRRRPGPFVLFGQTSGTLVLADPFGGDQR